MEFTRISSTNIFCKSSMALRHPSPPAIAAVLVTTLVRSLRDGIVANNDRATCHWWHRAHLEIWVVKSWVETSNLLAKSRLDAQIEPLMMHLVQSG
jgi:hypothetical protein